MHILDINATGVAEALKPAGLENSKDIIASTTERTCTIRVEG